MDVQQAIDELNARLPLKTRQSLLSQPLRDLHRLILCTLATEGRVPEQAAMQVLVEHPDSALLELRQLDLVVSIDGKLVGAYPMTTESTPHRLTSNGASINAMCALDAVSVGPMYGGNIDIRSSCHVTGDAIHIVMHGEQVVSAEPPGVMVGIRWQQPQGDAAHSLCMEMVYLRDAETAAQWQLGDPVNISVFSLQDAVAFGAGFFRPLLED